MQAKWRSGMVATDDYAEPIANLLRTNRHTLEPRDFVLRGTWQRSKMLLSRFQLDQGKSIRPARPISRTAFDNLQAWRMTVPSIRSDVQGGTDGRWRAWPVSSFLISLAPDPAAAGRAAWQCNG